MRDHNTTLGDKRQTEQWWLIKIVWKPSLETKFRNQETEPICPGELRRSSRSEIPGTCWCRLRHGAKNKGKSHVNRWPPPPSNLLLDSIRQTTHPPPAVWPPGQKPEVSSRVALGERPRSSVLGASPGRRHHQAFPDNCPKNTNFSTLESNFRQDGKVKYGFGSGCGQHWC